MVFRLNTNVSSSQCPLLSAIAVLTLCSSYLKPCWRGKCISHRGKTMLPSSHMNPSLNPPTGAGVWKARVQLTSKELPFWECNDYYLKSPREDKTGKHLVLDLYCTILGGKQDQKRNIDSHLPTYFGEDSHQWSIVPTFEEETLEDSVAGWNRIMANNGTSIIDMLLGNFRGKKSYPV